MKSDLLINYVHEQLESVARHLSAYQEDREPERLHLLRVDIKKIKAVFSLFENIHHNKYSVNRLKSLFHKAGAVREMEICILLLVAIPGIPEKFILRLEKEKKKREELFEKNIPGYIKSVKNTMERIPLPEETVHKRVILTYFRTEMHKVKKKINTNDREEMHHLRMRLKKMMYLYEALPGKIQEDLKLDRDHINKLQRKAGDWHDTYTSIAFLTRQRVAGKIAGYISDLEEKEKKQFKGLTKKLNSNNFWKKQ